jgi:hypothetical protein
MMLCEPGVGIGIEADHADRPVVVDQDLMDPLFQRAHIAKRRLQLDMDQRPVPDLGQGLCKRGDRLVGPLQPQLAKLGQAAVAQLAFDAAHPLQPVVMEDDHLAVAGQLDVQLDPVTAGAGRLEGRQRILRRAGGRP